MNPISKILTLTLFLLMSQQILSAQTASSDEINPAPGETSHPIAAGKPFANGIFIVITYAVAYAGRKIYLKKTAKAQN